MKSAVSYHGFLEAKLLYTSNIDDFFLNLTMPLNIIFFCFFVTPFLFIFADSMIPKAKNILYLLVKNSIPEYSYPSILPTAPLLPGNSFSPYPPMCSKSPRLPKTARASKLPENHYYEILPQIKFTQGVISIINSWIVY